MKINYFHLLMTMCYYYFFTFDNIPEFEVRVVLHKCISAQVETLKAINLITTQPCFCC